MDNESAFDLPALVWEKANNGDKLMSEAFTVLFHLLWICSWRPCFTGTLLFRGYGSNWEQPQKTSME